MSIMEKSQQMRISKDNQDYLDQQRQKLQPVIDAKNQADLATQNAIIQNAALAQDMRTQIAQASPQATKESQAVSLIPDPGEKAAAYAALGSKYSFFAADPTHKLFLDGIHNAQVEATADQVVHQRMAIMRLDSDNALEAKKYAADRAANARITTTQDHDQAMMTMSNNRMNAYIQSHGNDIEALGKDAAAEDQQAQQAQSEGRLSDFAQHSFLAYNLRQRIKTFASPKVGSGHQDLIDALKLNATPSSGSPTDSSTPQASAPAMPLPGGGGATPLTPAQSAAIANSING